MIVKLSLFLSLLFSLLRQPPPNKYISMVNFSGDKLRLVGDGFLCFSFELSASSAPHKSHYVPGDRQRRGERVGKRCSIKDA